MYDKTLNKMMLLDVMIEQLNHNLIIAQAATQQAIDSATSKETIPDNKYDTLALEAAYLAHGQAMRVQACEDECHQYVTLCERLLAQKQDEASSIIEMGSLVYVEDEAEQQSLFFIGPCAGGLQVNFEGQNIRVLTRQSPLGKALWGQQVDDDVIIQLNGQSVEYQIIQVW